MVSVIWSASVQGFMVISKLVFVRIVIPTASLVNSSQHDVLRVMGARSILSNQGRSVFFLAQMGRMLMCPLVCVLLVQRSV